MTLAAAPYAERDVSDKLRTVPGVTGGSAALRLVGEAESARALLSAWSTWMLAMGLSHRTATERVAFIRRLSYAVRQHPLQFTTDALAGYLATIPGAGTRSTYYSAMKAWSAWLIETGHRSDDPVASLRRPRTPRGTPHPISTAHLEVLLTSRMHRRTRAMILLGAFQGFRVHEIAKVRGEDIDRIGQKIRVAGKGGVVKWAPMHPVIADLAKDYPPRGWWFPSYDDPKRPIRANSASAILSEAMKRCGVPGTAHSLRHWFATELVRSGANARTVQTLLRHATMAHIAVYTEIADEQQDEAIRRLPLPQIPIQRVEAAPHLTLIH